MKSGGRVESLLISARVTSHSLPPPPSPGGGTSI